MPNNPDALDDLKSRLSVEAVVGADHELKHVGRMLQGVVHDSLKVDPANGRWRWYSRDVGGDALAWFAYQQFGRTDVDGADFLEVIKTACAFAGMDFEATFSKDSKGRERAEMRRRIEGTLGRYAELAATKWTAPRRADIRRIKAWITDEVISRWGLGVSPTPEHLRAAGFTGKQLAEAGLIRPGRAEKFYPHFRKRMIIPFVELGRTVYLSGRRLMDWDSVRQESLDPAKKALNLPLPQKGEDGIYSGGAFRPDAFNIDTLGTPLAREMGARLVEGPLDAIQTEEQGRPAIGLVGSGISERLADRLGR